MIEEAKVKEGSMWKDTNGRTVVVVDAPDSIGGRHGWCCFGFATGTFYWSRIRNFVRRYVFVR